MVGGRHDGDDRRARAAGAMAHLNSTKVTIMTTDDRPTMPQADTTDPDRDAIPVSGWEHFDPGATVVSADGEELGTVRERMPHYLELRAEKNLLADVEWYLPRAFVERVEERRVVLNRTAAELREMDLSTPPALQ
jgi:hypothetical protein